MHVVCMYCIVFPSTLIGLNSENKLERSPREVLVNPSRTINQDRISTTPHNPTHPAHLPQTHLTHPQSIVTHPLSWIITNHIILLDKRHPMNSFHWSPGRFSSWLARLTYRCVVPEVGWLEILPYYLRIGIFSQLPTQPLCFFWRMSLRGIDSICFYTVGWACYLFLVKY